MVRGLKKSDVAFRAWRWAPQHKAVVLQIGQVLNGGAAYGLAHGAAGSRYALSLFAGLVEIFGDAVNRAFRKNLAARDFEDHGDFARGQLADRNDAIIANAGKAIFVALNAFEQV